MSHWFLQRCGKWNRPKSMICLQTISLIEKWHHLQITQSYLLNSVLFHTGFTRWSYRGLCVSARWKFAGEAPKRAAGTPFFTPLFCMMEIVVLVLLPPSWVNPPWYRVVKCSSRTGVVLSVRWATSSKGIAGTRPDPPLLLLTSEEQRHKCHVLLFLLKCVTVCFSQTATGLDGTSWFSHRLSASSCCVPLQEAE